MPLMERQTRSVSAAYELILMHNLHPSVQKNRRMVSICFVETSLVNYVKFSWHNLPQNLVKLANIFELGHL